MLPPLLSFDPLLPVSPRLFGYTSHVKDFPTAVALSSIGDNVTAGGDPNPASVVPEPGYPKPLGKAAVGAAQQAGCFVAAQVGWVVPAAG